MDERFDMGPLSDESIGIIFGRNWVQKKISMKTLAQKRCKCTFAGNLEKKNCTGGIIWCIIYLSKGIQTM